MDQLRTAVVDITTLISACHTLTSAGREADPAMQRRLRNRLRRDIGRGTVAYIDALARSKRGFVDRTVLATCRVAAEQQMPRAVEHQDLLDQIMRGEPGSLDGFAAARQDLWRLALIAIHLRGGTRALRESGASGDMKSASSLAGRLRRRLRKALIAYARTALRNKKSKRPLIVAARHAALAQLGKRSAAEAERLSDIESAVSPTDALLRQGVAKPLLDLALDWQQANAQ